MLIIDLDKGVTLYPPATGREEGNRVTVDQRGAHVVEKGDIAAVIKMLMNSLSSLLEQTSLDEEQAGGRRVLQAGLRSFFLPQGQVPCPCQ